MTVSMACEVSGSLCQLAAGWKNRGEAQAGGGKIDGAFPTLRVCVGDRMVSEDEAYATRSLSYRIRRNEYGTFLYIGWHDVALMSIATGETRERGILNNPVKRIMLLSNAITRSRCD